MIRNWIIYKGWNPPPTHDISENIKQKPKNKNFRPDVLNGKTEAKVNFSQSHWLSHRVHGSPRSGPCGLVNVQPPSGNQRLLICESPLKAPILLPFTFLGNSPLPIPKVILSQSVYSKKLVLPVGRKTIKAVLWHQSDSNQGQTFRSGHSLRLRHSPPTHTTLDLQPSRNFPREKDTTKTSFLFLIFSDRTQMTSTESNPLLPSCFKSAHMVH